MFISVTNVVYVYIYIITPKINKAVCRPREFLKIGYRLQRGLLFVDQSICSLIIKSACTEFDNNKVVVKNEFLHPPRKALDCGGICPLNFLP